MKVIIWVIIIAAALYFVLFGFAPKTLGFAEANQTVDIIVTIIILVLLGLLGWDHHLRHKDKPEPLLDRRWTMILILTAAAITHPLFNGIYYNDGNKWEKVSRFTPNYPWRGGKFSYLPGNHTITLKDNNTVTFTPIPEKGTELLNLIGEKGSKGFPAFVEAQIENYNLENPEKFRTSLERSELRKWCTIEISPAGEPRHRFIITRSQTGRVFLFLK